MTPVYGMSRGEEAAWGWAGRGSEVLTVRASLGEGENILNTDRVAVTQLWERTENHYAL